MAEKDTEGLDEKSLELPSLFGRKKKRAAKDAPAPADAPAEAAPAAADPAPASRRGGMPDDATVVTEPVREPAPATDDTVMTEPVREPAAATDDTVVTEPVREPVPQPTAPADPAPAAPTARAAEPARPPKPGPTAQPAPAGGARKAKPTRSLPSMGASIAALVVGALVGLLGVGLTWGSLQACDALTGTDSCGGPGLLVVLVVLVVMIMTGSALLRALGVTEPGGLSFLGVAIFVAICLVFLLEHLLDPWMVVVGPALCALGYGTANWVVNRFNTELLTEDQPEPHDVR